MADPIGNGSNGAGKARSNRSRAACSACRQTKQRCDGPNRVPCRRCELYGLQCEYPPSSGPAPKPARATGAQAFVPPPPFTVGSSDTAVSGAMSDRLREISERLRSIEHSLENVHLSNAHSGDSPPAFPPHPVHRSSDGDSSSTHSHNNDSGHLVGSGASSNPMATVNEVVDLVETMNKDSKSPEAQNNLNFDWLDAATGNMSSGVSTLFGGVTKPDAILRGIMSVEECEATFQIFFAKLSPWTMYFDQQRDNNAAAVRERNPLLFHAILLSTSYYLMGSSERGTQVYHSLTALVNELIAPQLISPQPHQVTTDLVRALTLLILYKPVQFASLHADGITEPDHAEQVAKLNTHAASFLAGLMIRTSFAINLPSITNTFAKTFSPNLAMPPQVLSDLRLWYWICAVDTHSALTTGRSGQVDIHECLRTTRLFASLKAQAWDVRLAATVELYATAKFAVSNGNNTKSLSATDLRKFNKDLDDHAEYWAEPLKEAGQTDGLAYTVLSIFSNFIRVVVNSSVFTRWRTERKNSLARGDTGRPELSTEDWSFIQIGIKAAEKLVFSLSMESRSSSGIRQLNWPVRPPGTPRPHLTLDPVAVDTHRTAFDTIVTVVYVFTLILMAKMANTGLIRCELNCLEDEYNAGISLNRPQRLVNGAKLGRLLELGAAFLEGVAPNPSHPAKKHAKMLRTILAAGTMGQLSAVDPDGILTYTAASNTPGQSNSSSTSGSGSSNPADNNLPPPPQFSLPTTGAPTLTEAGKNAGLASMEAGETLASLLTNIQPSFFGGDTSFFDGMDLGGNLDGSLAVDWDKLEQSMQMQLQYQGASLSPANQIAGGLNTSGTDYFSRTFS